MLSIIKSKFALFQMQAEGAFVNTSELSQPGLGNRPEVFYSVDVIPSYCKFIFSMPDPVMSAISEIYKTIICLKRVSIYNRAFGNAFS